MHEFYCINQIQKNRLKIKDELGWEEKEEIYRIAKKEKLRKGKYKVINWNPYNEDLKKGEDLTIWFTEDGIENGMRKNQKQRKTKEIFR